jgi:DNA processing protein
MDAYGYWLALRCLKAIGYRQCVKLLDSFHDPKALFYASKDRLKKLGLKEEAISIIHSQKWVKEVEAELQKIKANQIELITYNDPRFPPLLKQIPDSPPFLYLKGDAEVLNSFCIAIVGTRRASFYGLKIATRLAISLAELGFSVVSGLARGVDTAAHKGSLQAQGKTIAVLGCGLDVIYPSENKKIYAEIEKNGAIISEFPLGTPPLAKNFPLRNRLISGLSLGVVVIEASLRSGSLITAKWALEQGREVFAVPGPIDGFHNKGTHALIKQGAKLVETVIDILEELNLAVELNLNPSNKTPTIANIELDPLSQNILSFLQTPKSLDEIALTLEKDIVSLSSLLTMLEIKGLVKQLPGKQYIRIDL